MNLDTALRDYKELIKRHPEVRYIDAILFDICGQVRGKRISVEDAEKIYTSGIQIPESAFLLNVDGLSTDPCGRGVADGDPDGTLLPIPGTTAVVPWGAEKTAQVLTNLRSEDGTPSQVDPRNIATAMVDRFSTLGYNISVAFELEFYLLDQELDRRGCPQAPVSPRTGKRYDEFQVYSIEDLDDQMEFLDGVQKCCKQQCIPATVIVSEYSPSQYEVNLRHVGDPVQAADHCLLLRRVVQAVAKSQNLRATFMSKPFLDLSGNGMHLHVSLQTSCGENAMKGETSLGSSVLRHAVGGLLHSMADMMAIFAPNENSYRRFVAGEYIPVSKTWGANNRSVAVRIPGGDSANRRLEHRVSGADANPYLVLAAVLAGMHHGLTSNIDPGPPSPGLNESLTMNPDMPFDWESAIDRFESSEFATNYLTSTYVKLYSELKRGERKRFYEHITDREYNWYL